MLLGRTNYFYLGQASLACAAIDAHASKRLHRWQCRKHMVRTGKYMRYPNEHLWQAMGLTSLNGGRSASRGPEHDLEREPSPGALHAEFEGRGGETWSRWRPRHRYCGESRRKQLLPLPSTSASLLSSTPASPCFSESSTGLTRPRAVRLGS